MSKDSSVRNFGTSQLVDWDLAIRVGGKVAPKGPDIPLSEAVDIVTEIRDLSNQAVEPVAHTTGLRSPSDSPQAAVIDRKEWIASNVESFAYLVDPLLNKLEDSKGSSKLGGVGAKATAAQLGSTLGWLSGKVLGQYEALVPPTTKPRLLLNAPNMVKVARELEVDEHDFYMWVCLHEETHRLQFTAVPWLSSYMEQSVAAIVAGSDSAASTIASDLGEAVRLAGEFVRGRADLTEFAKLVAGSDGAQTLDSMMAMMTLLEGHADFVMDAVGPQIVPSVDLIRERFNQRRSSPGIFDNVMRRAMGMDAKLKQYSEGSLFVSTVVERVGMDGFNLVWTSAETLPNKNEIRNPEDWISRVAS